MRSRRTVVGSLWAAIVLASPLCCAAGEQVTSSPPKNPIVKKTPDSLLAGPAFTFEQVLRLARQSAISVRRRAEAIQRRGLAFSLSPEIIDKLKAAGAPDDVLEAIKRKAIVSSVSCPISAPPPPVPLTPPPPKRPPEGKLAIRCAPGECEIQLNETSRGSTRDGRLELAEVPVGQTTITFKKDGYLNRQAVVTVEAGGTVAISEILSPNRATQEAFGNELFQAMIRAMGLSEVKSGDRTIEAAGTASTWTCEGRSVRWMLWMRNQPERALFQIKAGGGLREVLFNGSQYATSKRLKAQDAVQLATDTGLIRDNQLSSLIARINSSPFKLIANRNTPAEGEELRLVAEGAAEKISLTLDDDLLPRQIQVETAAGSGSRIVSYSDYSPVEGIGYPKTMHIKPEGWRNSVDVHFDVVRTRSTITSSAYKLKGKLILDSKN